MKEKEPQILGEQILQERKEQISPFDLYLEQKLNELNNLELQGSKEEIVAQVGKIIWEKLKDIFIQFPQTAVIKEDDIQSYADNFKTYVFTIRSLLNFTLKYKEDETRKNLYQAFFSKQILKKENEIKEFLETKNSRVLTSRQIVYNQEEIGKMQEMCLEWQKYNKKQTEEVLSQVDFSVIGRAPAMKALEEIRPIDGTNQEAMIKEIKGKYPFMRHLYGIKYQGQDKDIATRNAVHVLGTATVCTQVEYFIDEVVNKFSFDFSAQDIFLYFPLFSS